MIYKNSLVLALIGTAAAKPTSDATTHTPNKYLANAKSAVNTLQQWYSSTTGLWETTGWWNAANCLTVIADLTALDSSLLESSTSIFDNTLARAPNNILANARLHGPRTSIWARSNTSSGSFESPFYDDEGWWALAWIQAFDVTHDKRYLAAAEEIFELMRKGWGATCGGLWWDAANTANVAIANELFLSVAAHLARRVHGKKEYYRDWAVQEWRWFEGSGMINGQETINDGLNLTTCENNGGTVWSYNQGVVLGGLVELSELVGDSSLVEQAERIARAGIKALSDENGVLHDPCEPNCGADGAQFKGIFTRNLKVLYKKTRNPDFNSFLEKNADSIWAHDRGDGDKLGIVWSGPFKDANASTQSSACDALVAAAAVSK